MRRQSRPALTPELARVREQMAEFWGFGPRSRFGLGEIAAGLRDARAGRAGLGALYASIPQTFGSIGRRCALLREVVAGIEKESA